MMWARRKLSKYARGGAVRCMGYARFPKWREAFFDRRGPTFIMICRWMAGVSVELAGRRAMHFGPWLLGAPSIGNPGYFNELQGDNQIVAGSAKAGGGEVVSAFAV